MIVLEIIFKSKDHTAVIRTRNFQLLVLVYKYRDREIKLLVEKFRLYIFIKGVS